MQYKITKPIRLIELFAGIGSQSQALKNINANFESWLAVDFDKNAIKSYNAIHGTDYQPQDITQLKGSDLNIIDTDQYEYILTYSFPCQDISNAGDKKGFTKNSGTRSSLLWEVERLLNETPEKPQVLLMENVKAITNKNNIDNFNKWIDTLDSLGYKSYWQILRASDYGTPQIRDRCFMISIYNSNDCYIFPEKQLLTISADDLLDQDKPHRPISFTDYEKQQYLSQIQNLNLHSGFNCVSVRRDRTKKKYDIYRKEASYTVIATRDNPAGCHQYPALLNCIRATENCCSGMQLNPALCYTLTTQGNSRCGKSQHATLCYTIKKDHGACGNENVPALCQTLLTSHGFCGDRNQAALCHTIPAHEFGISGNRARPITVQTAANIQSITDFDFFKLNANEPLRLMGFKDPEIEKAQAVTPPSVLYNQAGNSICVTVLEAIFKQLL